MTVTWNIRHGFLGAEVFFHSTRSLKVPLLSYEKCDCIENDHIHAQQGVTRTSGIWKECDNQSTKCQLCLDLSLHGILKQIAAKSNIQTSIEILPQLLGHKSGMYFQISVFC